MEFRKLKASEIECRIQSVKDNGFALLLYKDARCDMNILDETVQGKAWKREHQALKGNIYCGVSIKIGEDWITKWDAGAESNTEKVKGEASDSFKRACFNWGIGRELYTSPFIWLTPLDFEQENFKKKKVYTKFEVVSIEYYKETIKSLTIMDSKGNTRFTWGNPNIETAGKKVERLNKEIMVAMAELSKEKLPKELALEIEDLSIRREVTFATLKALGIKDWASLDLTKCTKAKFLEEFIKQGNKNKEKA